MNDAEFTKLVNDYSKLLFTICFRFVKDYQEAENLTQDTFLTAYRSINNFIGDSYKPWLARIATNKCKDFLKSSFSKTTSVAEDETLAAIEDDFSLQEEVESTDTIKRIRDAVMSLPPPYHEIAFLHYIEDKSFDEVSIALERPLKTVQTQAYRARDKLREILKEEWSRC